MTGAFHLQQIVLRNSLTEIIDKILSFFVILLMANLAWIPLSKEEALPPWKIFIFPPKIAMK